MAKPTPHILLIGGGIGGMSAALALAKLQIKVTLLEQAPQLGEIGAGLQLAPNAFAALDWLGVGEAVRRSSVFTERMVMMDAVDCAEVGAMQTGEAFRKRFNNPYAVTHRADLHQTIHDAVKLNPLISFHVGTQIASIARTPQGVTVTSNTGATFSADAVVGCDGVKSVVREQFIGDPVRVTGHVVYRAVVPVEQMPADLRWNAPVVWSGPNCHLVHYPLRSGDQYNLVVTFHSRDKETWRVSDGSKAEVLSYFEGIHAKPRQLLNCPTSWRRWATADREPIEQWGEGPITLLGDAAHPMMQYLAQGACMAIEDAVTLAHALERTEFDIEAGFRLYEKARVARTARTVLSVREMGRLYHAKGVERLVRNSLWEGRTPAQFFEAVSWLYDWTPANCLSAAQ
jgi:3-hydroxybenzoate 6-monooxygenase